MHSDRLQEVMQMENQSCPKMLWTELLIFFSAFYLQYHHHWGYFTMSILNFRFD